MSREVVLDTNGFLVGVGGVHWSELPAVDTAGGSSALA